MRFPTWEESVKKLPGTYTLEVLSVYKLQASGVGGHRCTHYRWLRISHRCGAPHYVCSNDLKMPSVTVVPGWETEGFELLLEDVRTGRSS